MNEYLVGIDIGSSKICAAVGKVDKYGELMMLGVTSVDCSGLKKSIVVDIDRTVEAISKCIEKLKRMVDIEIEEVFIAISGGICEIVHNKGIVAIASDDREIRKNDVVRALEAAKVISISSDKEIIGVEPEQFILDGFDNIKDPIGMSGLRLEVNAEILVAHTTTISNFIKCINKAGVGVEDIYLKPKVLSKVVLKREEKELGTVIVDVGAETTEISIIKNDILCYTVIIPLGGNSITNDIAIGFKIPYEEAEKIKIRCANFRRNDSFIDDSTISAKTSSNENKTIDHNFLMEIIDARVEEILLLIRQEIVKSNYYGQINNVVLVGGGLALIRGIEVPSNDVLGMPVRVGAPDYVGAANPVYSAAVGIVKNAYDILKQKNISKSIFSNDENDDFWNQGNSGNSENKNFISKIRNFIADIF